MKRVICGIGVVALLLGFSCSYAEGLPAVEDPDSISSYPLRLAVRYTTNLIFPFAIAQVDLGSGDVIAKKMGKAENILLLKAGRPHIAPTNISVYLENGKLYSFSVYYADSISVFNYSFRSDSTSALSRPPSQLAQFSGLPVAKDSLEADDRLVCKARRFLKVSGKAGKLRLTVRCVYLKDKLLWLGFKSNNKSLIDFQPELMRFSIEDCRQVKRTAVQAIEVQPVYSHAPETLQGGSKLLWAVGLTPLTVARGKRMAIEWSGNDGRRIHLVLKGKHILKARALK